MRNQSTCTLCSQDINVPLDTETPKDRVVVFLCSDCKSMAQSNLSHGNTPDQQILKAIQSYGSRGISHIEMLNTSPFSMFEKWDLLDFFLGVLALQEEIVRVDFLSTNPHYFAKKERG